MVAGWLECETLIRLGQVPRLTEVQPSGSLIDHVLTRNIPPHRPTSIAVACSLVLARPLFKAEMRKKMSDVARARAGNVAHPLAENNERWWKRAAVCWRVQALPRQAHGARAG